MANRPPVLSAPRTFMPAHGTTSLAAAALFSATDPDGQAITQYQFFDGTIGSGRFSRNGTSLPEYRNFSIDAADLGSLVFTPALSGSDEIWIQAFDGSDWSDWAIVTVTPAANARPVVTVADLRPVKGATSLAAASLFSVADGDGDTITRYRFFDGTIGNGRFTLAGAAQAENVNIEITAAQLGSFAYQTSVTGAGDTLWVQAFDGYEWSDWKSFNVIAPQNAAPVVTAGNFAPASGVAMVAASTLFTVSDADGDAITQYRFFDGTIGNGRFLLNGTAQVENANIEITAAQLANFRYEVSTTGVGDTLWVQAFDGSAWSAWESFTATAPVNNAPVVSVSDRTPARGSATLQAATLFTVSDADGDAITRYRFFDGTIGNGRFLLNGAAQAENVNIEITAAQLDAFAYQVSGTGAGDLLWVQAFDGSAWSDWKSFNILAPQNAAPVINAGDFTPARDVATVAASTLFTVSDADGDAIARYRFFDGTVGNGRFLLGGTAQVENANIEITATQLPAFAYQVSSTGSGDVLWVQAFDGIAWGSWKSFTVDAPRNAAPVVTVQPVSPAAGTAFIGAASLFTVTDADGDVITQYRLFDGTAGHGYISVNGVAQPSERNITIDAAAIAATRFVTSPDGDDVIWVQAFDGLEWSEWRSFTIDATPAGPTIAAPIARADIGRTNEDTALSITVLANDDDGGSLALRVASVTQGAHGTVSINSDGSLRYSPAADYFGTDSFGYTIVNEAGSSSGSVTITIDPVNDAPVARNDSGFTTPRNAAKTFTVQSLLANDSDVDGDTLRIAGVSSASGGTVALVSGNVVFTPTTNYSGAAGFTYSVSDGKGGQASAQVSLTVLGNTPPVAADDSATGSGPMTINVLANDSDANGDTLSILGFTQPSHGTVTLNANNTFTYVPTIGYVGGDSFGYTLSDQQGGQDSATVTISVMPVAANFRQILSDASEANWVSLNINAFSDVWTPKALRPSGDGPISIIGAWSSMAWDPNRGDLIFFGGGHAHYGGNDVYRWRSSTLSWERASLPTQVTNVGNHQETVDGAANTPIAAHTYDNSEFLPIADRWMTWGGAAYNTGGMYLDANGKQMGPYFWDPSLADGNKIGSAPGSGVDPATPAVDMWTNRSAGLPATGPRPGDNTWGFIGGTTAYAQENGKDVIYLSDGNLWKYTVNDVNDPTKDTYEKLGIYWNSYGVAHGAGAIDVADHVFVRSTGSQNFTYWDLNQAGPNNRNVLFVPTVVSGTFDFAKLATCGMDFDSKRGQFVLWNGDKEVWILTPPDVLSPNGWTLRQAPLPTVTEIPVLADTGNTTGVFGKWKYIAEQDIFLGVMDQTRGTVWAYKPEDWQPQNSLPSLAVGNLSGLRVAQGTAVDATNFVTWSDADGDHVHFTFTDQTASASSGHFRLNGVDQAANVAISISDAQLQSGALLWISGQAGSQDQIRVTAGDPFGEAAAAINFMTPVAMASLIAQAPASLASAPSGTEMSLLQSSNDQIYLVGNGV